jgi:hypothetical protein
MRQITLYDLHIRKPDDKRHAEFRAMLNSVVKELKFLWTLGEGSFLTKEELITAKENSKMPEYRLLLPNER